DLITPEQSGVARLGYLYLSQHLSNDNLDVFIVDLDALKPINLLNLIHEMFLQVLWPAHVENFMRNDRTLRQLRTFFHKIALEDDHVFVQRNEMFLFLTRNRIS